LQNTVGVVQKKKKGWEGVVPEKRPQEGGVPWWWVKNKGSGVWHGKNNQTWAVVGGKKAAGMGKESRTVETGGGGGGVKRSDKLFLHPPQLP
jgi:hypothetical protein